MEKEFDPIVFFRVERKETQKSLVPTEFKDNSIKMSRLSPMD